MQLLLDSLTLYSTPFDQNYDNVADDYISYNQYLIYLNAMCSPISLSNNNAIKSIKINGLNGEIVIQLNLINYIKFENSNYVVTKRTDNTSVDDIYDFFFITRIESLFDSSSTKTFKLYIKRDVWTKYYFLLKESNIYGRKIIGHIDDLKNLNNQVINTNHITDEEIIPTKYDIIDSYSAIVGNYAILWARVWLDGESIFYWVDGAWVEYYALAGNLYFKNSITTMLLPYAVIDITTRKIVKNITIEYGGNSINTDFINSWRPNNSHIMKVDFTFKLPGGGVTATLENNKITLANIISYKVRTDVTDTHSIDSGNYISYQNLEMITGIVDSQYSTSKTLNYKFLSTYPSGLVPNNLSDTNIEDFSYEPRANLYPYKYKAIRSGDLISPLYPLNNSDEVDIEMFLSSYFPSYSVNFKSEGNVIKRVLPYSSTTNGQYETSIDSYQSFIRNNGNEINAQLMRSMISNISSKAIAYGASIVTQNPMPLYLNNIKATANTISNKINIAAQLEDSKNKRDEWIISQFSALSDLYFQDDICILSYKPENNEEFERVCFHFHKYGVNCDLYDNVMNIYRTNYDYSKYSDLNLNIGINNECKEILISIFTKGFTRWHLSYNGNNLNAFLPISYNVYNLPKSYIWG